MIASYRRSLIVATAGALMAAGLVGPAAADDLRTFTAEIIADAAQASTAAPMAPSEAAIDEVAPASSEASQGFAKSTAARRPIHKHRRLTAPGWHSTWVAWIPPVRACPPNCGRLLMLGVGF